MPNASHISEHVSFSLACAAYLHTFLALSSSHIETSKENEDRRKIKKEMPDVIQTIYTQAAGPIPAKDSLQMQTAVSSAPLRPDIIYYLLCIIQIAIHLQLVILLASGLSHSLSYQLTRFNANGSTQKQCLHINYWQSVVHDKSYYGNSAELNCTWEEAREWEWQERMRD